MAKALRYTETWFKTTDGISRPEFEAGKIYPLHPHASLHVARGIAAEVEVDDAPVEETGSTTTTTDTSTAADGDTAGAAATAAATGEASSTATAAVPR